MLKRYLHPDLIEAGCDEAGRGCLAGPVYAAAVILNPDAPIAKLNDSKKLSEASRNLLRVEIEQKALAWAVASCSEQEIDQINILNASILAMQKAVKALQIKAEHLLIDGNRFKAMDQYKHSCIIQGDGIYAPIAAASILAKTHRDEFMMELARKYPEYGFEKHKGYATQKHVKAIEKHGYLPIHRKSFSLKKLQLSLFS